MSLCAVKIAWHGNCASLRHTTPSAGHKAPIWRTCLQPKILSKSPIEDQNLRSSIVWRAADEEGTEVTILKEGAAKFHSYASGRRFCTGVVVTLDLRPRMELFQGHVLNAILPQDDILDLEVTFPFVSKDLMLGCLHCLRIHIVDGTSPTLREVKTKEPRACES